MDYNERTTLYSYGAYAAAFGMFIGSGLLPPLIAYAGGSVKDGYFYYTLILSILLGAIPLISLFFLKERPRTDFHQNAFVPMVSNVSSV